MPQPYTDFRESSIEVYNATMNNIIDLQIQTTFSDGKHTPRECIQMARDLGIRVISITDHDTVDGVDEALKAGEELGIRIIPGIEMSVEDRDAHILGYGIDHKDEKLLAELDKFKQGRIEGAKKIMDNLKNNEGFAVEWDDVLHSLPGANIVTSLHVVKAVMARSENQEKIKGMTKQDFYNRYLSKSGPNYVRRTHIPAKDAIALIHHTGGVAVWSHPAISFQEGDKEPKATNYEALENFLQELIGWGLDGLEVFGPSHAEDDGEFVQNMAAKYSILRTAGSDFHEAGDHPRNPIGLHSADRLGDFETYGFPIDDVILKLDEAINFQRQAQ